MPLSVAGVTNPMLIVDPGTSTSSVGVFVLSAVPVAVPPLGFRLCWGPSPADASPVNFPLEVLCSGLRLLGGHGAGRG